MASMEDEEAVSSTLSSAEFTVTHQEVELDVDFATQSLSGHTAITIQPLTKELKAIRLNCRQISVKNITVDSLLPQSTQYHDPYEDLRLRPACDVHQHHLIHGKLQSDLKPPPDGELAIALPKKVKITELGPQDLRTTEDGGTIYKTITVDIYYTVKDSRDGLHWVGLCEDDSRHPHVYTRTRSLSHEASCFVFPCVDSFSSRSTWKITVLCSRTLRDIVAEPEHGHINGVTNGGHSRSNGDVPTMNGPFPGRQKFHVRKLTEEEKSLELSVVCSGYMEESDAPGDHDRTQRKWVFTCNSPVAPQHIGFAIGPFEQVELSDFRDSDQDEKLGQNAVRVHGFCLPGHTDEVRNTCAPIAMALDYFTINYGSYPFETEATSYKMCFVEDLADDIATTATLSICSTRLLVPPNVCEQVNESIRELVRCAASQWIGINVVPKTANDFWIILGGAYFMADSFMQTLWGRNEHRFRQKINATRVVELDVRRPSIHALGDIVSLDRSNWDFMRLKAPLVFFILNQRLVKASGRNGVNRIFWRLFLDLKVGKIDNNEIDTERFLRICERVGHAKLDAFFQQWVFGSGCPAFRVGQKFNKKKLVVEMSIQQVQGENEWDQPLQPSQVIRHVKEHEEGVFAGELQPLFTGPMTIRIHEADGTPYEHIVDIKEVTTKVEIPYNTKYKRLKRSKRAKERAAASHGVDTSGDGQDDALLYCLGDVLQSEEEFTEWRLEDWDEITQQKMQDESYEWIRLDKDFEWICRIIFNQPGYMYVSQLQQDNDVVAQVETLQYLMLQQPFKMISTICIRTLMDSRYFYGIRVMATEVLARCAKEELDWIGLFHLEKAFQELFCFPNLPMTRSNDFSDPRSYALQCAIPKALASVRNHRGEAPESVKRFFLDKLKFNDNSNNEYSDSFYVATLLSGLARTLVTQKDGGGMMSFEFDTMEQEITSVDLQRDAVNEIERHRRIDEWIPSYDHILTTTALDCLLRLSEGKDASPRIEEFLQYTQPGNTDTVRLKAFGCLIALGSMRDPMICCWILFSFRTDPSPYFRNRLWQIVEHGLGEVALSGSNSSIQPVTNGLIVEGDAIESRQEAMERTKTLAGAMKSLKIQLGQSSILQEAIMEALKSPLISMNDFFELLTICRILYDPIDRLVLNLRLPRYWQVEHLGNGLVRFKNTGHYRTKPKPKFELGRKRSRAASSDVSRSESPETKRPRTFESPTIMRRGRRVSAQSISPLPHRPSPHKDTDGATSSPGPPLKPARPSRSRTSSENPVPTNPVPANPVPANPVPANPVPTERPGMIKLKGLDKAFLARLDGSSTSPALVDEVQPPQPPQPPQPVALPPPTGASIGAESQVTAIVAGSAPVGSPPPSTDGKPIKLRIRFS